MCYSRSSNSSKILLGHEPNLNSPYLDKKNFIQNNIVFTVNGSNIQDLQQRIVEWVSTLEETVMKINMTKIEDEKCELHCKAEELEQVCTIT